MNPASTKEVSKRLREVALTRHDSLAEFARSLGMKAQTLNDYLSGKSLPGNKLQSRLRAMGYDVEYVMIGTKGKASAAEKFGTSTYPLVSHIRCGSGTVNPYAVQSRRMVEGPPDPRYKGALFVEVRGKSMEPRWEEGDIVLVHPKVKPKNGEFGVVCWDREEGALKKVFYHSKTVILQSINPAFESMVVTGEDIWFLGKVLWTKHKV